MTAAFDLGVRHGLEKIAQSWITPSGDRDGPQTDGEAEAETSATGLGSTRFAGHRGKVVRKSGNQGAGTWKRSQLKSVRGIRERGSGL